MSSTFEHLDIEFEEINKLGIAEIIALKGEGGVLSEQVKQTLLNCFNNVAWVDEHGQEYVDALRNALYPPAYLVSISAVYTQSGTIYPTDSLDDLREDLVVTATYSDGIEVSVTAYALSGTLQVGESIITVSYGGKITTFTVEVSRVLDTYTITNNLIGASNSNSATFVTEGDSYSATITANESHTLVGATISITMGGVDITSTAYDDGAISIAEVTGDLVITVVAVAIVLENISAVYTQSETIYDTNSLDDLRTDLVVTATYSDSSTETIPSTDYTLSGTLTVGTSTITVAYGGKTTTFNVTVTHSLVPSGYTLFDYVQASGQQVVASGLSETDLCGCGFEYKFMPTGYTSDASGGSGHIFSSVNNYSPFPQRNGNQENLFIAKRAGTEKNLTQAFGNWSLNEEYTIKAYMNGTSDIVLNDTYTETLAGGSSSGSNNKYVFFAYGGNTGTARYRYWGRLYYFKIYNSSGTLTHHYVPVKNPSNVAGLYDVIAGNFLSSSTSTPLTVG